MQTLEAILSLAVFASIVLYALQGGGRLGAPDDSLYRMHLAEDAWRILFLRGDFEDFSESRRAEIEQDLDALGNRSSLCFFINGTRYTNCRGGLEGHRISIAIARTLFIDGRPAQVRFSLGE